MSYLKFQFNNQANTHLHVYQIKLYRDQSATYTQNWLPLENIQQLKSYKDFNLDFVYMIIIFNNAVEIVI